MVCTTAVSTPDAICGFIKQIVAPFSEHKKFDAQATALDNSNDTQDVLREFFNDKVLLRQLHEAREHEPELTFMELKVPVIPDVN